MSQEVKLNSDTTHLEQFQKPIQSITVFSKDTFFDGNLTYTLPLKIQGQFKGRIVTKGSLWIDKEAFIEADIITGSLKLEGTLRGNVTAYNKVELLPTAKIFGNIKTTKLDMDDTVIFEGNCEMLSDEVLDLSYNVKNP